MAGGFVHRLGIVLSAVGGVWCAALVVRAAAGTWRARAARRRRELLMGVARPRRTVRPPGRWAAPGSTALREWCPPVAAGLAAVLLVGGAVGVVAGVAAAYGTRRWRGRPRAGPETRRVVARLPLVAELLAACLAAGASPGEAAGAVGRALGGPLGDALLAAAAELRLGGDPAECWNRFGSVAPARPLGRWMARACTSGVPSVAAISRLAAEYRAERARAAVGRARRAAVLATAPLGLCFLPAFLAVGVVPVLIGLAEQMVRAR